MATSRPCVDRALECCAGVVVRRQRNSTESSCGDEDSGGKNGTLAIRISLTDGSPKSIFVNMSTNGLSAKLRRSTGSCKYGITCEMRSAAMPQKHVAASMSESVLGSKLRQNLDEFVTARDLCCSLIHSSSLKTYFKSISTSSNGGILALSRSCSTLYSTEKVT